MRFGGHSAFAPPLSVAPSTISGDVLSNDALPRLSDVALLLCGKALTATWGDIVASSEGVEILGGWYLKRIAFFYDVDPSMASIAALETAVTAAFNGSGPASLCGGAADDVNFTLAVRKADGLNLRRTVTTKARVRPRVADGVLGSSLEESTSNSPCAPGKQVRSSFTVLQELLQLAREAGGESLATVVSQALERYLPRPGSLLTLHDVARLLELRTELNSASLHALGSLTKSFCVWMSVSWNCASAQRQCAIVNEVNSWAALLRELMEAPGPRAVYSSTNAASGLSEASSSGRLAYRLASLSYSRDLRSPICTLALDRINRVFDGSSHVQNVVETLVNPQGVQMSLSHPLSFFFYPTRVEQRVGYHGDGGRNGDSASANAPPATAANSVLFNTTCGVLMYVDLYLELRAVSAAMRCADMAVLSGHQLHSSDLLAMAHYSRFHVNISTSKATAAADDLAIVLQLTDIAPSSYDISDTSARSRSRIRSLGYLGAAQLLLFFPSVVEATLRSILMRGSAADRLVTRDDMVSDVSQGAASARGAVGVSPPSPASGPKNSSNVEVVHSISQTVRHVLWLSELNSLFDSATLSFQVVTRVLRETLILVGVYYGIYTVPQIISSALLRSYLAQLEEDARVRPLASLLSAPSTLLKELVRQTAHQILLLHANLVEAPPRFDRGVFDVLPRFLQAVRECYGENAATTVEKDAFLETVYVYARAHWLWRKGFATTALLELGTATRHLLLLSQEVGLSHSVHGSGDALECAVMAPLVHQHGGTAAAMTTSSSTTAKRSGFHASQVPEAAGIYPEPNAPRAMGDGHLGEREGGGSDACVTYWPPDYLCALVAIQMKRAEVALFLDLVHVARDAAATLAAISTAAHFVIGVLHARLIDVLILQHQHNPLRALESLVGIEDAARSIGLVALLPLLALRRVGLLIQLQKLPQALDLLNDLEFNSLFKYAHGPGLEHTPHFFAAPTLGADDDLTSFHHYDAGGGGTANHAQRPIPTSFVRLARSHRRTAALYRYQCVTTLARAATRTMDTAQEQADAHTCFLKVCHEIAGIPPDVDEHAPPPVTAGELPSPASVHIPDDVQGVGLCEATCFYSAASVQAPAPNVRARFREVVEACLRLLRRRQRSDAAVRAIRNMDMSTVCDMVRCAKLEAELE